VLNSVTITVMVFVLEAVKINAMKNSFQVYRKANAATATRPGPEMGKTTRSRAPARERLWREREEGYVKNTLLSHHLDPRDTFVVFSHGGNNAAPVEMALAAKEKGLTVVAVTSLANRKINQPNHSSGKAIADIADIVIDNCSPAEDALISIEGLKGNVAASSTLTFVAISMSLVAETTAELARLGKLPERVFVSPNVKDVPKTNNEQVFRDYKKFEASL